MNILIDLVFKIQEKPGMYLSCFSVFTLKAFLDGWLFKEGFQSEGYILMNDFQTFIIQKYNQNAVMSWDKIINLYANSEKDAMELFFKNFKDFLGDYRPLGAE
ncbi:hypothetical protein AAG747_28195 [Rapidithrix thailandica]|uniref:Uncharacterized protein n=1 Tax=Rapidithrix thailandica TaxID=413964 RepID=A0AAW9S9K7_9BACT